MKSPHEVVGNIHSKTLFARLATDRVFLQWLETEEAEMNRDLLRSDNLLEMGRAQGVGLCLQNIRKLMNAAVSRSEG